MHSVSKKGAGVVVKAVLPEMRANGRLTKNVGLRRAVLNGLADDNCLEVRVETPNEYISQPSVAQ